MSSSFDYTPPKVWTWNKPSGGRFANINCTVAGSTHEKEFPVGRHPPAALLARRAERPRTRRQRPMKLATFKVNGVNGRLPILLRWLDEASPDIVCLQELRAPQEKFPAGPIQDAGFGMIWHGQKSWNGVAILSRGIDPVETRRGLPGDPDDTHSRYIEAAVDGLLVGCLCVPNGNPAPGPKFEFKLRWFEQLATLAKELLDTGVPVLLAGDYNIIPTDLDVYKPERWLDDALFRPEVRDSYRRLVAQGWTDALRAFHPGERIYTFWDYFRNAYGRDAGLRIDHLLLSPFARRALEGCWRRPRRARLGQSERSCADVDRARR